MFNICRKYILAWKCILAWKYILAWKCTPHRAVGRQRKTGYNRQAGRRKKYEGNRKPGRQRKTCYNREAGRGSGIECHDNLPASAMVPVFTQVDALPGPQVHPAIGNWNRQAVADNGRF